MAASSIFGEPKALCLLVARSVVRRAARSCLRSRGFCCRSPLQAFLVSDSVAVKDPRRGRSMMGGSTTTKSSFSIHFGLMRQCRRITRSARLLRSLIYWVHSELAPYYPRLGRPSIDPVLMIRMLIVSYVFGIRSERALCREVRVNLAYRWFCGGSRLRTRYRIIQHSRMRAMSASATATSSALCLSVWWALALGLAWLAARDLRWMPV